MDTRAPPGAVAFSLMVLLCAIWGLQQVAIKLAAAGISPLFQGGIRSALATVLLLGWAGARRIPLFRSDGSLWLGVLSGLLFAVEFALIFAAAERTSASRLVVFMYTAPCFTALLLHVFVPSERMGAMQAAGILLAFGGIVLAFADHAAGGDWTGDAFGLTAAFLWAATTVLIRASVLARITATKVLLYQLAVSGVFMLCLAEVMGERGLFDPQPVVLLSLAFQIIVVAFASYLAWFWLLARYQVGRLMVFSFLTPLFGVGFGVALIGETPGPKFLLAALLVAAGIVLVNLRRASTS